MTALVSPLGAEQAALPLFRLFLIDGSSVVSYGEAARLGDRVVFSLPLGDADRADVPPALHMASLPADRVDWDRTARYAESLRAARYGALRGEDDFARLTDRTASLLNEIAVTPDVHDRLEIAEQARRELAAWPADHYGYRTNDVRDILVVIDQVLSALRADAGGQRFDLSFVAGVAAPTYEPLLPPPTLQESIEQVLGLSEVAATPDDRQALLQSALALMDEHEADLDREWTQARREEAEAVLAEELTIDRDYRALSSILVSRARQRAERADVRGVQQQLEELTRRDEKLGMARPGLVQSVRSALQALLAAARSLRLERDRWELVRPRLENYQKALDEPLELLELTRTPLEDIKALAGPNVSALDELVERLGSVETALRLILVPQGAREPHQALLNAVQLARRAAGARQEAVLTGELQTAWDASAAAAGALMLIDRASRDVVGAARLPELP